MKLPRLTMKTAKALAIRELGTAKGLKRLTDTSSDVYIYEMQLGTLLIRIDNGWFACNGLIKLLISTNNVQKNIKYFNPKTLDEEFWMLDKEQMEEQTEYFNERVRNIGIEGCLKIIEAKR